MSLEEKIEALTISYQSTAKTNAELTQRLQELDNQNEYLRKQLKQSMKQKQRILESPTGSTPEDFEEDCESQHSGFEQEEEPRRTPRREWRTPSNPNDFRVELPEFEGKLDPDEFLEWLSTVERIFDYKEVPEDKKVKLIALRLRKYASLWWTNLCNKRIRERKPKIQTWDRMKAKFCLLYTSPSPRD